MGRSRKEDKAAAVDVARSFTGTKEETLAAMGRASGVKSRRTLETWLAEADELAAKRNGALPDPKKAEAEAEAVRQEGDAAMIVEALRFAQEQTLSSAGLAFGLDMSNPKLVASMALSPTEEKMIERVAPNLVPALERFTKYLRDHALLCLGVLYVSVTLPRLVVLAKVARQVKKAQAEADRRKPETAAPNAAKPGGGGGGGGSVDLLAGAKVVLGPPAPS